MKREAAVMDMALESPEEGELITRSHFSFRISAEDAKQVCVSIDGGSWRPCRPEAGLWRYDWVRFADGRHAVEAMMRSYDGNVRSVARLFWVEQLDAHKAAAAGRGALPI
jgi:hypothetical protein